MIEENHIVRVNEDNAANKGEICKENKVLDIPFTNAIVD